MNRQICSNEIEDAIGRSKPYLKEEFKVKDIGIFGSYIRGEQNEKSDLDVLVEFGERIGLFKFLEMTTSSSNSLFLTI
jgi:uncharacterized protein